MIVFHQFFRRANHRQGEPGGLRHVLGQMRIANHPQRSGMDQISVPSDDLRERDFGLVFRIIPQELLVALFVHSRDITRRPTRRAV